MRRFKILEIIPTLDQSGAEKQLVLLASGLPKEQFDVRVAVLTRDGPLSQALREARIPYTVIGKRSKISLLALSRLKKEIRAFAPDLVHTWIFAANAYGRKAAIDCGVPKIVCGERCVDPWKGRLHFAIDRYLAKKTDCFAVNSDGIRDFYVRHGLPEEKFVMIPNAVLPPRPSTISRREIFDQLGIVPSAGAKENAAIGGVTLSAAGSASTPLDRPAAEHTASPDGAAPLSDRQLRGPFLIGMIARFWPQKRLDEAIFAAEELKFTGCDFHLLIFGDGPLRDNLLRYREELGIEDRVHLLGHRNDVWQFVPHFDLLWCTSAYEGQSNSILEAMACGVPVIASDIPGNRELVESGVTGTLITEFSDKFRRRTAFCKESFRLFQRENAAERLAMGRAAKARIEKEFSLELMISRYAALYRRLIEGDERGRG